jgi:hypothetical protein
LIAGFFIADFGLKNGDVMGGEVVESCIFTSGDEFGISSGMGILVASLFVAAFDVDLMGVVDGRISSSCISTSDTSSDKDCLTAAFPPALERVVGLTVFLATALDFLVDDLEGGSVELAVALGTFVTVACVPVVGLWLVAAVGLMILARSVLRLLLVDMECVLSAMIAYFHCVREFAKRIAMHLSGRVEGMYSYSQKRREDAK